MYTIKAFVDGKEYTIHNPRAKALIVGEPYYQKGDNVNGQAEFSVYPTHPYYQYVKKLTTDIIFYKDGVEKFAGRVLYDDEDSKGVKKVFVEGELAYFCDSVQRPAVYHNISVRNYLKTIIDNHNSQVEERKQFTLGRVSVTDPNDSLYRYANWETTRETLKDKLVDRLGGHLVIRKEHGIRYLDYLNDNEFYKQNSQEIRFGKNLLDYSRNMDASDLVTCVVPLGAKLEESSIEGLEERLTIKSVNGGVDYVSDDNAVATYGKIYKTVQWDDVTVASNLIKKGWEYLKSVQFENMVLELKAIDLNLTDEDIQEFEIGDLIRCVSPPHGLDSKMPLSNLKIYINDFAKNTVVLGTEKQNYTYTSSNSHKTEEIEQAINSIPSKKEILQEALRDATELINDMNHTGNAIHTKNEFIVSDTPGVENAKNLWRWGLGGLAHYSQGYDGPVDGVALTMDGKINGGMILANSIIAESIDIGYRTEVETTIKNAEKNAEEYTNESVKAAKETISNAITNTENRINLNVTSTKEIVEKKNYVRDGEQETLSLNAFSQSGTFADVTVEEFKNLRCLKLKFKSTGVVYLEQLLGTLPAGNYIIQATLAFPMGETAETYRPTYVAYGFANNRSTEYLASYNADKYHTFRKKVQITEAEKKVSVGVYGTAGKICYVTNIRCLRNIQEVLDDLKSNLTVEIGKVEASVNEAYENLSYNYCLNGKFDNSNDAFSGWSRNNTSQVIKTTYSNKSCVKIINGSVKNNLYWHQKPFAKSGKVKVRFKAACESGSQVRVQVKIDGKSHYTAAGQISQTWKTFEFEDAATSPDAYFYFYNYTENTTVYITDIEILGYYSGYTEGKFSVMQDSITAQIKKIEEGLSDYATKAELKLTSDSFSTEVKKKVNKTEIISSINQSAEIIKIKAKYLELSGYATFYALKTKGETVINGNNITTGSISCSMLSGGKIYGQAIEGGTIKGASITGGTMKGTFVSGGRVSANGLEVYGDTGIGQPYVDFHRDADAYDYSARILESSPGNLIVYNKISNASDRRLKKDIDQIDCKFLKLFDMIKPKQYRFKEGNQMLSLGFIAQELTDAMDELGIEDKPIVIIPEEPSPKTGDMYYAVNYNDLIALLWEKVQALDKAIGGI